MPKYVISGFLFDKAEAEALVVELAGRAAGLQLTEMAEEDGLVKMSDIVQIVKDLVRELQTVDEPPENG